MTNSKDFIQNYHNFPDSVLVSLWAVSNPNLRISLITGLILSLGILGRGTLLISAISIIGWLIIKRQYLAGVTMALPLILCLMPIVARNAAYGAPAITTNGPKMLWVGNNPDANGTYNIHKGGEAYAITMAIAESDGKWLNHIMEYIRTQPLDWLQLTLQKAVMFFFLPDGFMPYNVFLVFEGLKNSWLLRFLPGYGIFVTLTFAGLIKLHKRRHEFIPLAVIYIPYSITTIAFFITTGFRVPITAILILFASATIVDIVSKIKRSRTISRAIPT